MAKIRTLSQATGRIHDSVKNRKSAGSSQTHERVRRRVDYDLILRCQQAWNNLDNARRTRERVKEYVYGDQWGDIIHYKNGQITEREYIQRKGNVPLQNNIMISILNSVVGLYDKQSGEPNCFAKKKDGQWLSDMMSATVQANWNDTKMPDVLRVAFTDYAIGGMAMFREKYGERDGLKDSWTDFINPNYTFWESGTDPRMTDLRLIGVLCDASAGELYSEFCNSKYGWTVEEIDEVFGIGRCDTATYGTQYGGLQQNERVQLDQISFDRASDNGLYRLIEVWTKETKTRYQCYDPLAPNADEVEYRVEVSDIGHVKRENSLRIEQYRDVGVPEDEWALIEYELIEDSYWYYTYMAPDGTVIGEGETPYEYRSHPFTLKLYPYVNSEIHPFMGTIIDQQRYINRLIIMHDMAARSAAKGITIFPIENIPDGLSKEDIADELTEYDGLLFVQTNKLNPNLRPEIITSNAVQIGTQELLQMELNLARDITNVSGALQGKTPTAGTSAARYNQETENATTSLNSIMRDFTSVMESVATKKVMTIKQFYRQGRLIANKDNTNFFEYDNLSARDVMFKVAIKEAARTAAFQTYINDTALELLNMQAINIQQYLEVVNLPYAKELLQIIQRDQAQQLAMQQELNAQGVNQQQVGAAQSLLRPTQRTAA
ncbi:MAG: hypothetical protein IJ588_08775 [Prevotella sp.]|nr:hypothetical protein [Prevotella sp.]